VWRSIGYPSDIDKALWLVKVFSSGSGKREGLITVTTGFRVEYKRADSRCVY